MAKKREISMIISYPDPRVKKELESLTRHGFKVTLIVWERGWPLLLREDRYKIKKLKLKNAPFGSYRALLYFPIWWFFVVYTLIRDDSEIIHVVNFDSLLIVLPIAKLKRKRIIYEMLDFYSQVISVPFPLALKILKIILANFERFLLRFVDALIIVDDSRIEQIGKDPRNPPITVIYNTPKGDVIRDYKTITPTDKDKYFKIFIGGGIRKKLCIKELISAITDIENIMLIIKGYCGDKVFRKELLQTAQKYKNISMSLDGVPHEEIIQTALQSDLIFGLFNPDAPNIKYASPNRLFEAMMLGKPIIVSRRTRMEDIVKQNKCGLVVDCNNTSEIKDAILKLKDSPKLCKKLGYNGRKAYEKKYNWEIMEERLLKIYRNIPF